MKKTIYIILISCIVIFVMSSLAAFGIILFLKNDVSTDSPSGECSISCNKTDFEIGESGSIGYICIYKGQECVPEFELISGYGNDVYEIDVDFTDEPVGFDKAVVYDKNGIKEKYISFVIPESTRRGSYRLIVKFGELTETFEHVVNVR